MSHDIELTSAIKEYIIANRVYIPPAPVAPPPPQSLTQIINYNNTINNFVANLDTIEKLKRMLHYNDVSLLECGDSIENAYTRQIEGLKQDPDSNLSFGSCDALVLDKNNLLEVVDQVSSLAQEHYTNFNIVYDKKFDKLKLYDMGKFEEYTLTIGIRTLLMKIQEFYFNVYECYLIRKIELSTLCHQEKAILKDKLTDYYRFIGCFDIDPFVKDKNDTEILYNEEDTRYESGIDHNDDNTDLPERFVNLYAKVRGETKISELNKTKKNVLDIVKKNCLKNVDELNKKMVDLFNMDEEFKQIILPAVK